MKKRTFRRREQNGVRRFRYIFIMALLGVIYMCGKYIFNWDGFSELFATAIAIVAAVAFWLEYNENKLLNEAQFITDLNEQFIKNEKMSDMEWELERFHNRYRSNALSEEYLKKFRDKFDLDNPERQRLVNYLVHLEGIAALVKNGIVHINMIDDLMSYRYFLAMNNPVIQELELLAYPEYYKGCIDIYEEWTEHMIGEEGTIPPMYDPENNNLIKKLEEMRAKTAIEKS